MNPKTMDQIRQILSDGRLRHLDTVCEDIQHVRRDWLNKRIDAFAESILRKKMPPYSGGNSFRREVQACLDHLCEIGQLTLTTSNPGQTGYRIKLYSRAA